MPGEAIRSFRPSSPGSPPCSAADAVWNAAAAWHEALSSRLRWPAWEISNVGPIDEGLLRRWLASRRLVRPVLWGTDEDVAYVGLVAPDEGPRNIQHNRRHGWLLVLRRNPRDRRWLVHTLTRGMPDEG